MGLCHGLHRTNDYGAMSIWSGHIKHCIWPHWHRKDADLPSVVLATTFTTRSNVFDIQARDAQLVAFQKIH
jgi:hypothetical protein